VDFRTRVKICGVRDVRTAEAAVEAGADAIGVVLAPRSPRVVSFERAQEIERAFGDAVSVVAVVEGGSDWPSLRRRWRGTIQVHGEESEARFGDAEVSIIRGFRWSLDEARRWDRSPGVAALLVDGPEGGSGRAFDHESLRVVRGSFSKPLILAGGLTPDSVAAAVERIRPYGVDVSSGVERSPGEKDLGAIRSFCQAVHAGP